jgi:hypothetical protein
MKKNLIIVIVINIILVVVLMLTIWAEGAFEQKQRDGAEICRVFRELGHARTIVYLDEIDVQDCPTDFRHAYETYVIEVRAAGAFKSSKELALVKLQDSARLHGVSFTPKKP